MRFGPVVAVSGRVDINATAAGSTTFSVSLPIPVDLTATTSCNGIGLVEGGIGAGPSLSAILISGRTANDEAQMEYSVDAGGTETLYYFFTYALTG
jgi:hypothetical protein